MKNNYKHILLSLSMIGVLALPGCMGSSPSASAATSELSESDEEEMVVFDASEGVSDLDERIQKMKKQNFPFYVPNSMAVIDEKYAEMVETSEIPDSEEDVFKEAKELNSFIDSTYKRKEIITTRFKSVLNHYNTLLALKSNTIFEDDFLDLQDDMKSIIDDYDTTGGLFSDSQANVDALDETVDLSSRMLALEILTVLEIEYKPSALKFEKMESDDYEDFAPATFNVAKAKLIDLKSYIESNHLNKEGIKKAKDAVNFEFDHLSHLVREVIYLNNASDNEQVLLGQERRYKTLMDQLNLGEHRDQKLQEQFKLIEPAIVKMRTTGNASQMENATVIAGLEKEIIEAKKDVNASATELDQAKTDIADLNMQIVTLKMQSDSLSKKLEAEIEKQRVSELANEKINDANVTKSEDSTIETTEDANVTNGKDTTIENTEDANASK